MPITGSVLETAARHPDRLAIAGDRDRCTYAELVDAARRTISVVDAAHAAQQRPPTPAPETRGVPITAVSIDSAYHAARIMAGLAGYRAVSAVIDPRWPLEHRVRSIVTTGTGLVVSDDADLEAALAERGWTGTILSLAAFQQRAALAEPAGHATVRDGDEPFLLLFSSGTTSAPKAFLKTRTQYRENLAVSSAHLEPLPGVATLAPGPFSYSLTLYALIECLGTGGTAHLADHVDPLSMAARIRDERITRVVAVPALVQAITDVARRDPAGLETLELVVTGGANLSASIRDGLASALPGVRLISYYGAAEIGFIGDSRDGDGTAITIYPTIGASIRDEHDEPVEDGTIGTLWIRAAARSDGYLASTSSARLVGDDGWASVGDLGRIEDGRLTLVGRAGDIAITGGHKVSLPEVERAFDTMPGAGTTCAIALDDAHLGSVVALVVETDVSRASLVAHARASLAPQFVPRRWYRVERLPRTVGGKVRRGETRAVVMQGEAVRL